MWVLRREMKQLCYRLLNTSASGQWRSGDSCRLADPLRPPHNKPGSISKTRWKQTEIESLWGVKLSKPSSEICLCLIWSVFTGCEGDRVFTLSKQCKKGLKDCLTSLFLDVYMFNQTTDFQLPHKINGNYLNGTDTLFGEEFYSKILRGQKQSI